MAYDVHLTASADLSGQTATLLATLPPGFSYQAGSTRVNGLPATDPAVSGSKVRWDKLPAPNSRSRRYGINTFLQDAMDPRHTATQFQWARSLGGPGTYVQ